MTENDLYELVAHYLNISYPRVLYRFDQGGMWTGSHKARNLYGRLNRRAWPDLLIARSTMFDGTVNPCAGLFLELKREATKLKNRKGEWATAHIKEQAEVLERLREQGYYAEFAVGFDQATQYIDAYLNPGAYDYHGGVLTGPENTPF